MNNIDELIERAQTLFGDAIYLSGPQQEVVEEMAAALREQQERIAELERQRDAALLGLEYYANADAGGAWFSPEPAKTALKRIRGMK